MSSTTSGLPYQWATIEYNVDIDQRLHLLGSTEEALLSTGYIVKHLDDEQLWTKTRCTNCHTRLKKFKPSTQTSLVRKFDSTNHPQKDQCVFHRGNVSYGKWSCCGRNGNAPGCCSNAKHQPTCEADLRSYWTFYSSPPKVLVQQNSSKGSLQLQRPTQGRIRISYAEGGHGGYTQNNTSGFQTVDFLAKSKIKRAVSLDCEMGTAVNGDSELIRITLVDFFNPSLPLIDSLVNPDVEMSHYNSKYSGVTFGMMKHAKRTRQCINGRDAARDMIFEYVDAETLVVVHGGSGDFSCLRWLHPPHKIIDTFILERDLGCGLTATVDQAGQPVKLGMSLKELADRKCELAIQNPRKVAPNRILKGHDSFEDALAARELVVWWLKFHPDT